MTPLETKENLSTSPVGLSLLACGGSDSEIFFDPNAKIVTRIGLQSINAHEKKATYSAAFSKRVILPVQDFYQKVIKGDPKATFVLLGIATIARYILIQKSWTASGLAAVQVAAATPFLAAHGMLIIGLIGGAGLVAKVAPYLLTYMRGETEVPTPASALQDEQRSIETFKESIQSAARTGALTVASGASAYAGRRLTVEGHGRIEAALYEAEISNATRSAARVAVIAVPTMVGAGVAYGTLRVATSLDTRSALITASVAGGAYALHEGLRYYTQLESPGVAIVRQQTQKAIQEGETTPVWEMTKGALEVTTGAAFSISSSAVLNTCVGPLATGVLSGAAVTAAERHTVAAWDREGGSSAASQIAMGAEKASISSFTQKLTHLLI